ncbi:MAG: hypothetical protein IKE36_07655 [Solobacterium sp.]|nr:hypothetical protein [Solobacterium sp.]
MKKIFLVFLCLLTACKTTPAPAESPSASPEVNDSEPTETEVTMTEQNRLNPVIDTTYGGFALRWNNPDHYPTRIILQKVNSDQTAKDLYTAETNHNYQQCWDIVGWAAQENDYYGDMRFLVQETDAQGKILKEEPTEVFACTDFFPEEKTKSISGQTVKYISYTAGQSSSMVAGYPAGTMSNCTVYHFRDEYTFSATYWKDNFTSKEIEKNLTEKDWNEVLQYLEGGQLIRKKIHDPDFIVLDGGHPESLQVHTEEMTRLDERFYEYELVKDKKEALLQWMTEKCK